MECPAVTRYGASARLPARGAGALIPRLPLPRPCPVLIFAGAPPETCSGRGRGSVQRPARACTTRTPGPQPSAPRRHGHQRLQQPSGHRRWGCHTGAGCVLQPLPSIAVQQKSLVLPDRLTATLPQVMPVAAAAHLPGSRPALDLSRAATAVALEPASVAMARQA